VLDPSGDERAAKIVVTGTIKKTAGFLEDSPMGWKNRIQYQ
jgi:hypothetical protein